MLAPSSDFSYAPNFAQQHLQSGERPKLFMQPDFAQMVHHGTPQHEPLLMTVQNGAHYFAPPQMSAQMLHVSSDYEFANSTPSSSRSSAKRSREDLNLKEKKRMFKLNDRIAQLKDMLDEAGVQTKKNKQSVLDNAAHYIDMLRNNLLIAKQKAERAEKQAEMFRAQMQKSASCAQKVARTVFHSTTPRLVVDMNLHPVTFNAAFVKLTGQSETALKMQKNLRPYLSDDQELLDRFLRKVQNSNQSASVRVQLPSAENCAIAVQLVAAVVTDDNGKHTNIEFSLIPIADESVTDKIPVHEPKPRVERVN